MGELMFNRQLDVQGRVIAHLASQVSLVIKTLLEAKYMYQNLHLDIEPSREKFKKELSPVDFAGFQKCVDSFSSCHLDFGFEREPASGGFVTHKAYPPATVNTDCEVCKSATPHNPDKYFVFGGRRTDSGYDESIVLQMKCQKCKEGILVAMIRRKGLKFQLVGRNQIETFTPEYKLSYLDDAKSVLDLFADSVMAERTRSRLAAICLLRVAIEQYMRSMVGKGDERLSGEELADRVSEILPDDFPRDRAMCLKDVYSRLSEIIHNPAVLKEDEFAQIYQRVSYFLRLVDQLPPER